MGSCPAAAGARAGEFAAAGWGTSCSLPRSPSRCRDRDRKGVVGDAFYGENASWATHFDLRRRGQEQFGEQLARSRSAGGTEPPADGQENWKPTASFPVKTGSLLGAVDEGDLIGVLLDGAGLGEVGEMGARVAAPRGRAEPELLQRGTPAHRRGWWGPYHARSDLGTSDDASHGTGPGGKLSLPTEVEALRGRRLR
jgi:hypothetical protein